MQYPKAFTDALQFVWGEGFLSPGGPEEVAEMLEGINLSGKRVLDIGAGIGGVDVLLADTHGAAEVVGVDVEAPLIEEARARVAALGLSDRVRFDLVAPGPLPYPDASFDVVFSKDALVHIPDKAALFADAFRMLRPGGVLAVSDWLWAKGAGESAVVQDWVSRLGLVFTYTTPDEARAALAGAGFADLRLQDRRAGLQTANRAEIAYLAGAGRGELARIVGDEMAAARLASAVGRQAALDAGALIPTHLFGRRP